MVVLTLIIEGDCQLIIFTLPTLLLSFFSLPKTPDALSCLKEFFEIQVNQKCQTGNAITLILSKLGPFSKIKYVSRASQPNLREKIEIRQIIADIPICNYNFLLFGFFFLQSDIPIPLSFMRISNRISITV